MAGVFAGNLEEICSGEAVLLELSAFFRHAIERANDFRAGKIVIMNLAVLFHKLDKIVIGTAGLPTLFPSKIFPAGNRAVSICRALIVRSRNRLFGRLRRDRKRREREHHYDFRPQQRDCKSGKKHDRRCF